jgi:hypothetical protein
MRGILDVRFNWTKPTSRRLRGSGTSTFTIEVLGTLMRCHASAAGPVITLPEPAYRIAATSRCAVVMAPLAER